MEINSLNSATASLAARSNAQNNSLISSDFETFLQMLTTQAKYQDPLEPIDNSEYASQLAQFSGVEQQVQTNDLLNAVLTELGTSNLAQVAGWIGMEARSTAPANFDGTPIELTVKSQTGADAADLVVYDSFSNEVQRLPMGVDDTSFRWDGARADGSVLPFANYSFAVESRSNDAVLGTTPAESYTRIGEARTDGGQSILVLASGAEVAPGQITALR